MRNSSILPVLGVFLAVGMLALGQTPAFQAGGAAQALQPAGITPAATSVRPDYVLGPGDQILLRVPQEEQLNERPFRIDEDGIVALPLVGSIDASGQTVQGLEGQIAEALRKFIRDPLVSITVVQYRSEPVFFVGALSNPGIYPLQGRRTLVEMLAAVGGILPDASRRITVTRRAEYGPIPLPNAVQDPEGRSSTVEISLESLTQNINPEQDIVLQAYDIVSVELAESVYVTGEVATVGPISLAGRNGISLTQALAQAGGFTPNAKRSRVVVLRPVLGTNRRASFEFNTNRILAGEELDFPLLPNDVVQVPRASARATLSSIGTGLAASIPYIIVALAVR